MTENNNPAFDMDAFMAVQDAHKARAAELLVLNKARLLSTFAEAGITRVTVAFNGYADEGQVEEIMPYTGDELADLPEKDVEIIGYNYGDMEIRHRTKPLEEAINDLCYGLLGAHHGGWENNEGAYGEFIFDVAEGTFALDFNYRITDSEYHRHDF